MEKLRCVVSPRLFRGEERGFGPGVMRLLALADEKHSLRAAAMEMNMSYSKAWSSVKSCEKTLGFALLERKAGGAGGGGASLTEEGRAFLQAYEAFSRDFAQSTEALMEKHLRRWL